jgi:hypothetical protein
MPPKTPPTHATIFHLAKQQPAIPRSRVNRCEAASGKALNPGIVTSLIVHMSAKPNGPSRSIQDIMLMDLGNSLKCSHHAVNDGHRMNATYLPLKLNEEQIAWKRL